MTSFDSPTTFILGHLIYSSSAMDYIDTELLRLMQLDASLSQRDLADQVGLSQNACWRRIQRLRDDGVLRGSGVRIDPAAAGLDLTVFVMVRTRNHSSSWAQKFRQRVEAIPSVVECHRIGGEWDYMLKVVTTGMAGYDQVYQQLIKDLELDTVTGLFAMETLLQGRPLPIPQT